MIKLPDNVKEKLENLTKKQLILLTGGLVIIAMLLGLGINGMFKGGSDEGIGSSGNSFVQESITFERRRDVKKGDLIIFKRDNALDGYLIKRVIAVPGDTVDIDDTGYVYVNGERYDTGHYYYKKDVTLPLSLKEGELFVLGDNGDVSADSRRSYVGNVRIDEIEGIAVQGV